DTAPKSPADASARNGRAEPAQRLRMSAEHKTAAGVAVEPMGERRSVRQAKAQPTEAAFEIRTAAGTGMHRNPCRLVDNQYEPVAIEHAIGQRFSGGAGPRRGVRFHHHQYYSAAFRKEPRKRPRSESHSSAPKRRNISGTVISLIGGG